MFKRYDLHSWMSIFFCWSSLECVFASVCENLFFLLVHTKIFLSLEKYTKQTLNMEKNKNETWNFNLFIQNFSWIVSHTLLTVNFLYKRSSLFCVICDLGKSFNSNAATKKVLQFNSNYSPFLLKYNVTFWIGIVSLMVTPTLFLNWEFIEFRKENYNIYLSVNHSAVVYVLFCCFIHFEFP